MGEGEQEHWFSGHLLFAPLPLLPCQLFVQKVISGNILQQNSSIHKIQHLGSIFFPRGFYGGMPLDPLTIALPSANKTKLGLWRGLMSKLENNSKKVSQMNQF